MLKKALEVLKKIEDAGFEAFIVGGFVRDYYMGNISKDVDITTSAKPKDLKLIFKDATMSEFNYGSVVVNYKNMRFEITTYRSDKGYVSYRKPETVEYVDSLYDDLLRRDFTMNSLCMDSSGTILDLLGGAHDIDQGLIKMIGDPKIRLEEDALRILRAVRFATTLNFELDSELKKAIMDKGHLLENLSYDRIKQELDRMFKSIYVGKGIGLLQSLKLDRILELHGLNKIVVLNDPIAIYAQLDLQHYFFTKQEKKHMDHIREIVKSNSIDLMTLYKYGIYESLIAASILHMDYETISLMYEALPIKTRKDMDITTEEICEIFHKKDGKWLKEVYQTLENKIIRGMIKNERAEIKKYLELVGSEWDEIREVN